MTCCLRGCCSSLGEHVSPEQAWSPTVLASGHSVEFANSGLFRLQLGCSGGTLPLGVDTGLQRRLRLPSSPVLKVGALPVASILALRRFAVAGTSDFVVSVGVAVSSGVLTFKQARGRPPGGPRDGLLDREDTAAPTKKETSHPNDLPDACFPSH